MMVQRCRGLAYISIGSKSLFPCWFYINLSIAKHVCNRLKYVSVGKNIPVFLNWVCAKTSRYENIITFNPPEAVVAEVNIGLS